MKMKIDKGYKIYRMGEIYTATGEYAWDDLDAYFTFKNGYGDIEVSIALANISKARIAYLERVIRNAKIDIDDETSTDTGVEKSVPEFWLYHTTNRHPVEVFDTFKEAYEHDEKRPEHHRNIHGLEHYVLKDNHWVLDD